jgi:serine/threonine protein kinase/tetratricopeptide (TPR) repeat protein
MSDSERAEIPPPGAMVGRLLGHYRIESQLGAGGMGIVYRAHDTKLGRTVAIKLVGERFSGEPTARDRLMREARTASALNHPHICTVHEVGEADGHVYIVMEYVEGVPLDQLLQHVRPTETILHYGLQIADAMAHAHDRGIVHRDLKTSNVMVTPEGRVKVLDFGLAKRVQAGQSDDDETMSSDSLTEAGQVVGTLHYLAPEVLRGEPADTRSDTWALGVLLYVMVSAEPPFQGRTRYEVTHAILGEPTPPFPPGASPALGAVIQRCLAKEPGRRYQRASEVRAALEAVRSGSMELPSPPRQRLSRGILAAAASVVALLLGVAGYLSLGSRGPEIRSIAVLPFTNVGGDPENEYLSDGVAENVIGSLSQLAGMKVIAFGSVARYKGGTVDPRKIGRELRVEALVTGGVEQRGDTLSIRADLVSVADGRELWGRRFTGKTSALISLQDDVTSQIIANLQRHVTGDERKRATRHGTENPEAYALYLRGYFYHNKEFTPEDYAKALDYYQQAIAKDPAYALAYAGLSSLYASMAFAGSMPPKEAHEKAEAAVRKASSIDDGSAEVQTSQAVFAWTFDWDWAAAEKSCQKAMVLNPTLMGGFRFCAQCSRALGLFEEAIARAKRAEQVDPLSIDTSRTLATTYYWAGQDDLAIAQSRRALELGPKDSQTHELLADIYARKGMKKEAIAELQQSMVAAGDAEGAEYLGRDFESLGYERVMRQLHQITLEGAREQARTAYVSPITFAAAYAQLGNRDQSFAWLDKALNERAPWLTYIKTDPAFDGLHSDPRFPKLLQRIGLPQ